MDMADTADASLLQLEDAGATLLYNSSDHILTSLSGLGDACGIGIAVSLPGKDGASSRSA